MKIFLNGKELETNARTIEELLHEQQVPINKIAVEANFEVVPKSSYSEFKICENAKIEIITFVGGG